MASVYLAELKTEIGFRRKVALKVVRSEFAKDKKFVALMGREAMIGSLLQHPNIVQTLEFNESDGRCFLALEYVEGQTLDHLLEKHRADGGQGLPLAVALEVMVQVLKGLAYAHSLLSPEGERMGIVHRDLKPANIMLSRHGLVKVMDFGIAKARIASANITTAGQVRGTPIYMAPEQVTGKELDGRADQFAAATVLYELLTGKQLFIAKNLVRIMQQVARAEVEDQVNELENLHPGVGAIAARMWSQDVEARYETCDEPAQLLEDIVFDLKAHQRSAQMSTSNSGPVLQSKVDGMPSSSEPTFLSALGLAVRNLLGTEKTPVTTTPKKRRRRKRKKRPRERETLARPVAATVNPDHTASDSIEMLFDDQVSDFDIPVVSESQSTPNIARPSAPPPPAAPPTTVNEETTSSGMQAPPTPKPDDKIDDKTDGALDPFFYENFD